MPCQLDSPRRSILISNVARWMRIVVVAGDRLAMLEAKLSMIFAFLSDS